MILEVNIENYRSFKEKVTLTLVAEPSKSKGDNVFTQKLVGWKDEVRILKTALIYGANASGKTNILRCLFEVINLIGRSNLSVGDEIDIYDPYLFSSITKDKPVNFSIVFVGKDNIKYKYELSYTSKEIVKEILSYFPRGKSKNLYSRIVKDGDKIHGVKSGDELNHKNIEVFNNQTILSKFGKDIPHQIISEVYVYLMSIEVINACNSRKVTSLKNEVTRTLLKQEVLKNKMNELLTFANTGINELFIKEVSNDQLNLPEEMDEEQKKQILNKFKYVVGAVHDTYGDDNKKVGLDILPLDEESHGTKNLYSLGGKILQALESGSILFIDEIETGLHPFLSKLLISLFQNKRINKYNSQLIFTTHDTNLLDRNLFRKDQFWFAEKNDAGVTDLYSLQDFNDVREDTPFDKWYMAGKFGGVPNIKSLESLFIEHGE